MGCKGKVALVTGAAGSGMGRSIALTLAREGAKVVVNTRRSVSNAEAVAAAIQQQGGQAMAVQADIFDAAQCKSMVDTVCQQWGQIDICIIGPGGGWHPEGIHQLPPEAAQEHLHDETAPIFNLMPLVLPGMYTRGWGRVIGIAMHLGKPSPAYAYNLGKAARTQALLMAAEQAWGQGVTINVIAPGPVGGLPTLEAAVKQCYRTADADWQARGTVSPQDIAEGTAFLCSEGGQFITGCVLPYLFH